MKRRTKGYKVRWTAGIITLFVDEHYRSNKYGDF